VELNTNCSRTRMEPLHSTHVRAMRKREPRFACSLSVRQRTVAWNIIQVRARAVSITRCSETCRIS